MAALNQPPPPGARYVRQEQHCHPADRFMLFHEKQLLIRGSNFLWEKREVAEALRERDCLLLEAGQPNIFTASIDPEIIQKLGAQIISTRDMLMQTEQRDFQRIGQATQLLNWYQTHQYCGACGSPTISHMAERAMTCPRCHLNFYPRINPCVIMLVRRNNEVLLARSSRPGATFFSCLAGFMEIGETPEDTVAREVHEEVGIRVNNIRYVRSQSWPFPSQLMLGFFADYEAGEIVPQPEEIAEADWFALDQMTVPIPPTWSVAGQLIDIARSTMGHRPGNGPT